MSTTIDHRVVEMRFDNKQFEAGAKQTMGTLDKLKKALKLPDVSKSFNKLQRSADQVDMSGLQRTIDDVRLKFSGLEVAAITALSNIVNRAVDAGVQLAKSLSIDQISAGFSEYELKMGSIQTIIASTGESLDTVNKYLQELNEYSDKTIYSFSDMTQNIGKFTNAGVKLEDAVKAIQGISNEAAISGANAEEASRAMYNFAQALSAGYVKLIDWKSIENANMATVEFKQQLLDTATALGTVVKIGDQYETTTTNAKGQTSDLFDATSMFNDSLNHQWMTTEVLVNTLNNYSNDIRTMTDAEKKAYEEKLRGIGYTEEQIKAIEELGKKAFDSAQDVKTFSQLIDTMRESVGSGWAQTFELIFGDFEEAKKLWTNVNNVLGSIIKESSDSRNELLREWKEAGGRDDLFGAVSNSFNSLLSIVKAVKETFGDVFPKTTGKQLADITKNIRNLTVKLTPSNKALNNLKRTFTGLFSVIHIGGQAFEAFFRLIIPGVSTVGDLGDGILSVTASLGDWVTNLDKTIEENDWFVTTLKKIGNTIGITEERIESFKGFLDSLSDKFTNLSLSIDGFSFEVAIESLETFKQKIYDLIGSNDGFRKYTTNLTEYSENLKEAFTFDNLFDRVEKAMDIFGKFFNWIKTTMTPAFKDFSVGGAVATGGGLGIIYSMISVAKSIKEISSTFSGFGKIGETLTKTLGSVQGVLKAYQKELQAKSIIKIAGAIAILAGALVLLSFVDTTRVLQASGALSLLAGVLLFGVSSLLDAVNKGRELNDALTIFSRGLKSTMKKFGRAIEIKAIGSAVKDFAKSIAIIAVSIIALGIMYKKDKDSLMAGVELVKAISLAMVGIMVGMSVLGNVLKSGGMKNFAQAALGMLSLSASLMICVRVLDKLFKMEFPSDWQFKIKVLAGMLAGLGTLALALGFASRISGKNKTSAGTILSMAVLLMVTVGSLNALFKMEFPSDWQDKVIILAGIFAGFGGLMIAIGIASRLAGGSIKAAGTILAMSVFVGTIVASLMVLSLIPSERLIKGAASLGIVLTTLGIALFGAGKITSPDTYKSILAMAISVGAIVAALAVLGMIPVSNLLKGAVSLGVILLILAENFRSVSKIANEKAWITVLAMVGATMSIAFSLYTLSEQPWQGLLIAAFAMSATLTAFANAYQMILKPNWSQNTPGKIEQFGLMVLATIPIALELGMLAHQPWDGMLAAATAMGISLTSFANAYQMILKPNWSKNTPDKLKQFGLMILATIPIALELGILANQPWQGLLAAAVSLSTVLIAMTGCLTILSTVRANVPIAAQAALALSAFVGILGAVMLAIGLLFSQDVIPLEDYLDKGVEILTKIGNGLGAAIGGIVNGVLGGVASALPALGEGLSGFMNSLDGFAEGSKSFDESVLKGVGILAACIIAITAAEVIAGVGFFLGGAVGLISMADNLVLFIETLNPFLTAVKGIDAESMEAVRNLAEMIIVLTAADLLNGIGQIFGLSGDLSEFGKQLSEFGPYIKDFANTVKNVKPEAVQGAASAAKIMSSLANDLPGTGGFAQKIFGDKSLAEFGKELVSFGPKIVIFANIVKDVKPESVEGAAAAGEIMAKLSSKLPGANGFAQKIFGDKSLAEFGKELVSFGPDIVDFANTVKNVKPEAVQGASAAAAIMSKLANELPSNETLWNKIFGGGTVSLSEFGEELINFGTSMNNFSTSISAINVDKINSLVTSFEDILNLTTRTQNNSAEGLVNFSKQLSQIGTDSVNQFTKSFSDANPRATSTVKNLCVIVIKTFKDNLPTSVFYTIAQNDMTAFISGINSKKPVVLSTVTSLCSITITRFRTSLDPSKLAEIGANVAVGLAQGIESKIGEVAEAAAKAGKETIAASKKALDENSPSKKAYELGSNWDIGFANGIIAYMKVIQESSAKASNEAIKPVENSVSAIMSLMNDGDLDIQPVIHPVVDLTNVEKSTKEISSMMDQTFDLSFSCAKAFEASSSFEKKRTTKSIKTSQNEVVSNGDTYEFNQYNYSPKALTRSEIYRQTSNQFSAFRKAVNPS